MEITFATEELKEVCLAPAPKADSLPREVVSALHALYNAMRNADHVGELPLGRPGQEELSSDLTWRINLVNGYGVIMRIDQNKLPRDGSSINWTGIYRVKVMVIEAPDA